MSDCSFEKEHLRKGRMNDPRGIYRLATTSSALAAPEMLKMRRKRLLSSLLAEGEEQQRVAAACERGGLRGARV